MTRRRLGLSLFQCDAAAPAGIVGMATSPGQRAQGCGAASSVWAEC